MKVYIDTHGNKMPEQHGEWIDLYTAEDCTIRKGDFKIIPLGYQIKMPEGYYAQIVPRSSTCKNYGIMMANSVGIIENEYCGVNDRWGFPAVAIKDTFIPAHTRICQFCVKKKEEQIELIEFDGSGETNRGGFGSTGVN